MKETKISERTGLTYTRSPVFEDTRPSYYLSEPLTAKRAREIAYTIPGIYYAVRAVDGGTDLFIAERNSFITKLAGYDPETLLIGYCKIDARGNEYMVVGGSL
jgi:hypothetical protein